MPNPLAKYYGALKATGGSPGVGNMSKADKKLLAQGSINPTSGRPKSRLSQAYQANKRNQLALMNKLNKIG